MNAFRILSAVLFTLAALMGFGWLMDQDVARAVGLVAAGLLCFTLSTIAIRPVP